MLCVQGLIGAARFYYFNVFYECVYAKRSTHEDDDAMSSSMAELDLVIGCGASERSWIQDEAHGWKSNFILTGMEVGLERRAWRFTPSLPLQLGCVSRGVPDNDTKFDPHVLVGRGANGTLTLAPLIIDFNGRILQDCAISFEQGALLDVAAARPLLVERQGELRGEKLHSRAAAASAAPYGLWIVQPQSASAPSVSCMANHWHGMTPFNATWPLKPTATQVSGLR